MIDYSDLRGLASIDAGASFADATMNLEKALDDYYLSSISGSRQPQRPRQRLAYPWAKELEVKNIRMIVVSKSTGKDNDQVRRLLRNVCA